MPARAQLPSTGLIHVSGGRDILRPLLRPPLPVSLRRPNPRSNLPRRGIHSGEVDYLRSVPDSIFVHMYDQKVRAFPSRPTRITTERSHALRVGQGEAWNANCCMSLAPRPGSWSRCTFHR